MFDKEVKYLSIKLNSTLDDSITINHIRNNITWNTKCIVQLLPKAHHDTICTLITSKCMNLYGCETVFLKTHEHLHRIETAWNCSMRRCFNLHFRTHVNILCGLSGISPLRIVIYERMLNFNKAMLACNPVTEYLAIKFNNDTTSFIGSNYWNSLTFLLNNSLKPNIYNNAIYELLYCRRGLSTIPNFNYDDINCLLNFMCTS